MGFLCMDWNLADAKNRFSELVNLALTSGPQRVNRRRDSVIVMSIAEYERLKKAHHVQKLPHAGESFDELDLERDSSASRDLTL